MYFPIGWPKTLKTPNLGQQCIRQVVFNLEKIFIAILTEDCVCIWFWKPSVPIVYHCRTSESLKKYGTNIYLEWKPDSSMLVIATSEGHLIFYNVEVNTDIRTLYVQNDSPQANLRRDSAELFIKEVIPPLLLSLNNEVSVWDGEITSIVCINVNEIMVSNKNNHILRYRWDGTQNRDYSLDLRRIPFCINKQVSKAEPIVEENVYVNDMEYSPLAGGFAVTFNDGRAAFLTATSLRFDPNTVQGIWAQGIEDATCASINHKFRLITFGRKNSECIVYIIDETTGGLEISHECILSNKDYPGSPGAVHSIKWSPDSCAMIVSWENGGLALWSTFGALLMCTLGWDYGLNVDLIKDNPLIITSMDWSTEGYQLWMSKKNLKKQSYELIQMDFVKSPLTVNPCMSHQPYLFLQGEEKIYLNLCENIISKSNNDSSMISISNTQMVNSEQSWLNKLSSSEARQWMIISAPTVYISTNSPIKFSAIDPLGQYIAIAGRTGLAHYSLPTRKWKLFGNETQEKDFIVVGGLLWWRDYLIAATYSFLENNDELRIYPRQFKLDNKFMKVIKMPAQILLVNCLQDQMVTFCADAVVNVYELKQNDSEGSITIMKLQIIDISNLCVHSACIVSIELTSLRIEPGRDRTSPPIESIIFNSSGKLLLLQREKASPQVNDEDGKYFYTCSQATVLASNVENVWAPGEIFMELKPLNGMMTNQKPHLIEALWLACGASGMRVWLPLYPRRGAGPQPHAFISKRIMLPFQLKIYPLAILFDEAIILGVANDTVLYTNDMSSPFSLPYSILERTSQVYLHQILRQLIRRNLGYNAWEIARSCQNLPYFPHSLELLLHEVLEEEATSKEPIPDAQLPSVIEFISEFPVYLQTIVQCARKTEIALWPYLFSVAGKPKHLFQECITLKQLDTAASYLIILQNLETSAVSRQYATLLLDTVLELSKWDLAKELVRFLRAIDPNDVESPRSSFILPTKLNITQQTPPMSPNAEELSLVLGSMQVARSRSISTSINPLKITETNQQGQQKNVNQKIQQKSQQTLQHCQETNAISPNSRRKKSSTCSTVAGGKGGMNESRQETAEEFFIDVILQRHARRLLTSQRLSDLGYFAAHLDFHLVVWLAKERERAARIDDYVKALKQLHEDFSWPYPDLKQISQIYSDTSNNLESKNRNNTQEIISTQQNLTSSQIGDSGYNSLLYYPRIAGDVGSVVTPVQSLDDNITVDKNTTNSRLPFTNEYEVASKIADNPVQFYTNSVDNRARDADTASILSVTSSIAWGGNNETHLESNYQHLDSNSNWSNNVPNTQIFEQLSQQMSNKGSSKSEVQLRYLLHLFMEASCLEWSLIISILLRDPMSVLRTVNAAKSQEQTYESVCRLRDGFQTLLHWTHVQCLGYKPFMVAIQNQLSVLNNIIILKQQKLYVENTINNYTSSVTYESQPILQSSPTRSRKASTNQNENSPSVASSVQTLIEDMNLNDDHFDVNKNNLESNHSNENNDGYCAIV